MKILSQGEKTTLENFIKMFIPHLRNRLRFLLDVFLFLLRVQQYVTLSMNRLTLRVQSSLGQNALLNEHLLVRAEDSVWWRWWAGSCVVAKRIASSSAGRFHFDSSQQCILVCLQMWKSVKKRSLQHTSFLKTELGHQMKVTEKHHGP